MPDLLPHIPCERRFQHTHQLIQCGGVDEVRFAVAGAFGEKPLVDPPPVLGSFDPREPA
jgi:hypothetical protein